MAHTTNTTNTTERTHTDPNFRLFAEVATDIAHSYWDSCGQADTDEERAELEANHDRWADIAGDFYEGRMPTLTEEEQAQLDEWAEEAEAERAMALVVEIAEANPKAVSKDVDALLEIGEVDCEAVWAGYLADAIVAELGDTYTEHADLFDSAIVDFYCDQMASFDEEEE